MGSWDPVGADGFNDTYSLNIAQPLYDAATFESPVSAINTSNRTIFDLDTLESKVEKVGEGEDVSFVGLLDVPANALKYDALTNAWKPVGEGVKAFSKCTYTFAYGKWHDGTPQSLADILYMQGFVEEWISKDGEDDKEFEDAYSSKLKPSNDIIKGWVLNEDGSITTYFNYNFPPSQQRVAAQGAPSWTVTASGQGIGVSWTVIEALAHMVAEGSKSGTEWSFSSQSHNEVDVLIPACVEDIKAKLQDLLDEGHVPAYVKGYMTEKQAKEAYANSIAFIENYGHAFISNGMFWLEKYDPVSNFMQLTANRDPSYPYSAQYWVDMFAVPTIDIDKITMPSLIPSGKNLEITVKVSKVVYPNVVAENAEEGRVTVRVLSSPEIVIQANLIRSGEFKAIVPGTTLVNLPKGTYKVQVEAQLEGALEASETKNIVIW
jgi:peptide/nickel transport system substrate-binding protein